MKKENSTALFKRAQELIPGGVNSPVRACRSVGTDPLFISRADGCRLFDADGNPYIDYIGSWGPMILGHRHPAVIAAISSVLEQGTSYGAPTDLEVELAGMVVDAVASVDMVRMVNSGTEATMSAIRLARGYTGRDKIIKFDGCYHGHADSLLVEAGSGVATLQIPGSPGVPASFVEHTLSLPYNDIDTVRKVMAEQGDRIACIIVEPVAGNMGMVLPDGQFLETLRETTEKYGAVLIFDEVMTGFRVAFGGAQARFGITPDLSCFGKIIGGGLPVGAYGGRREIMEYIAPQGPVYQAGTLSGNPLAMAAGIATLNQLKEDGFYERLDARADMLINGLKSIAEKAHIPVSCNRAGAMLGLFFTDRPVKNFADAKTSDLRRFSSYYQGMLENGVYLAPSQFEAFFLSAAHDDNAIEQTLAAAETVFGQL
ncbi:glutamate-1-semialdehyde 2,1-aminomutase 2 [Desulfosarcina alkanivorans]|jgi:glutamate-1-semialdehyde 2,1-aminomutase|uniref:Glutamate-1-semialdehyde 2,1-aminomutase n=1 Tax=Desulfosarcina alkanivorans TaxID=571177 RepID=A0A5K7Y9N8_9BACT|nr:glutamate-1-semialdehyde 2,1-aminomutase [Desulfosarcina alkanivorans]BBO66082.1 glutamate-1-semialdehyde 2,1-aminomutase 2 [Desulfosarcina alkanivorans]